MMMVRRCCDSMGLRLERGGGRSRILMPAPWKSAQLDLELLRASCRDLDEQEILAVNLPSSFSTL